MQKYRSQRKQQHRVPNQGEQEFRVRLPRDSELFGKVVQLHGGKHLTVKCADDKMRMCRVPGKLKRIWVREEDYVLVQPWPIEGEKKGDIIWRYRQVETDWLRRNGHITEL